jgi:3-oxoacyl-[acyl-carrier-protein] synthase II
MSNVAITGLGVVRAPALDVLQESVRTRASRAERVTQLALSAAGAALAMAGLAVTEGDPRSRLGIVFGTAFGCLLTNAAYQRRFAEGGAPAASPRLFAATVSNAAAGEVAIAYRLGGPSITLTAGRVSGLVAIAHAVDLLEAGQADAVLAGGIDAMGEPLERWMADAGWSGVPAGEGAALLVLERMDPARARSARVLGTVCGARIGFAPGGEEAPVRDLVAAALADAGAAAAIPPVVAGCLAADGPMNVAIALEQRAPGETVVVSDVCNTGHMAAVVVRKAA